jgi:hypothetical protein
MTTATADLLNPIAEELQVSREELITRSVRAYLEQQLREIKSEILELHGRYDVSSVEELENRYRDGTLDEASSWRDLQRLDFLEYKRDRLLQHLAHLQTEQMQ